MLQHVIVGLAVLAAAVYLAWRYLPGAWRRPLSRVHPRLAEGPGGCGGGGGCSRCGRCAREKERPDEGAIK